METQCRLDYEALPEEVLINYETLTLEEIVKVLQGVSFCLKQIVTLENSKTREIT